MQAVPETAMSHERNLTISLDGGSSMRALLALPEGEPPEGGWPALLAIHDIVGFSNDIRRIARRFAASGYAALAPALFDGAGPPVLCVVRTFRDYQRRDGPAFARLEAAQRHLAGLPEVNGDRIGVTGFCLGGGFAIFYAARGGVQVCAPYYGDTPKAASELRRVCPVVAGFGELDRSFAVQGERLALHLQELDVPHDVKIYPGVGHSYMNDHGSPLMEALSRRTPLHGGYDEAAAEDSWERMLAFFAEHL
jgi:carboxymethylenebutenolidase